MLYQKPFISQLPVGAQDDRRTSLLQALGLERHLVRPGQQIDPADFKCELDDDKFNALRKISLDFLVHALGEHT